MGHLGRTVMRSNPRKSCWIGGTMKRSFMNIRNRLGFTLVELMILCVAIVVMLALLSPMVRRLQTSSHEAVSMSNAAQLGAMHAMYAADWGGRQFTNVPDDLGAYSTVQNPVNNCIVYVVETGCYPSGFVGVVENGAGFYVCISPCDGLIPGASCSGAGYTWPYSLFGTLPTPQLAMFRFLNLAALNVYANGRWYDEVFFAPNDVLAYATAESHFDNPAAFVFPPNPPAFSSYCSSPAAMFHPDVFAPASRRGPAWQFTFADRFKSPTVSECLFPDLKTQIIEHNWNQNPPAEINPAVADGITPYQFNHGLDSTPITLFFDGHVNFMSIATAVADDTTVMRQTRSSNGLWSRDTPLGPTGYKGDLSFDGIFSGHHMLTIGGIAGRDVLAAP
jgi:hypothetical protein